MEYWGHGNGSEWHRLSWGGPQPRVRHFGLWKGYRGSTLFTELSEQEEESEVERTYRSV